MLNEVLFYDVTSSTKIILIHFYFILVNLPAHLVIVKGTEYFDAKTSRYIDYPVTDVLQMMGRGKLIEYSYP